MAGKPSIRRGVVPVPAPSSAVALEALKQAAIDFDRADCIDGWRRTTNNLQLAAKLYARMRST